MGNKLSTCREQQVREKKPGELCSGQPGVDFHIQCMRQTVKFANEIKVTGNACAGRLGFLERKKSVS